MEKKLFSQLLQKYKAIIFYIFFGGLTTLVNILIYALFYNTLHIRNIPSVIIAWLGGCLFAFITNKLYVFNSQSFKIKILLRELISFFLCRLTTGLFDAAIMHIAVDKMNFDAIFWKTMSNIVVIILNFLASKFLIFKKQEEEKE